MQALFALAALLLAFGPPVDAAAHAAKKAVEAGRASPIVQVLSAFDVIDDVLDHIPGESAGAQQHVLGAAVWPPEGLDLAAPSPLTHVSWKVAVDSLLASRTPDGQDRPPRT